MIVMGRKKQRRKKVLLRNELGHIRAFSPFKYVVKRELLDEFIFYALDAAMLNFFYSPPNKRMLFAIQ